MAVETDGPSTGSGVRQASIVGLEAPVTVMFLASCKPFPAWATLLLFDPDMMRIVDPGKRVAPVEAISVTICE